MNLWPLCIGACLSITHTAVHNQMEGLAGNRPVQLWVIRLRQWSQLMAAPPQPEQGWIYWISSENPAWQQWSAHEWLLGVLLCITNNSTDVFITHLRKQTKRSKAEGHLVSQRHEPDVQEKLKPPLDWCRIPEHPLCWVAWTAKCVRAGHIGLQQGQVLSLVCPAACAAPDILPLWAALGAHRPGGGSQHPHQGRELPGRRNSGAQATYLWTVKKGNFWIKMVISWKLLAWRSISLIQQDHFRLRFVVIKGGQNESSCLGKGESFCSNTKIYFKWWRAESSSAQLRVKIPNTDRND